MFQSRKDLNEKNPKHFVCAKSSIKTRKKEQPENTFVHTHTHLPVVPHYILL